jgi:hypothetical protein
LKSNIVDPKRKTRRRGPREKKQKSNEFLSRLDVATLIGCGPAKVIDLEKRGILKPYRFSNRLVRYRSADVQRLKMATVGRFIGHFKRLGLQGWQIGGDQGFGGALMDRMAEQGWHLKRVRNGDPAKAKKDFFNADAERWSTVRKLIENRQIIIRDRYPERLERLVKQLTRWQKISCNAV